MTRQVQLRDIKLDSVKSAMALAMAGEEHAQKWLHHRYGSAGAPSGVDKMVGSQVVSDMDTSVTGLQDRALFSAIRERSILFRMRGIRRTGFRTRSITSGGALATWIQAGKPIPVHKPTIENAGLDRFKIAGLTIATEQSVNEAPGFEELLFSDMVGATVDKIDSTLLNPAVTAVSETSPASITNGVTAVAATTNSELDIQTLIEDFDGDLSAAYFTMHPNTAAKLAATRTGRDVGVRGGELLGVPVLTGRAVPTDSIALVDPTGIMAAWDEVAEIEAGREGAVEMSEEPTQSQPTGAALVSLYQSNLVAFRSIAMVNWTVARSGSVSVLQGGAGSDWLDNLVS